jgi:hypothetical protein
MVLLISGGHCLISIAQDIDKFLLLGESLDDAPGEALDKVILMQVYLFIIKYLSSVVTLLNTRLLGD